MIRSGRRELTAPDSHLDKIYHVQIQTVTDDSLLARLETGIAVDGENWKAKRARVVRKGEKNSWLEIVLDEGKNRQIRKMMEACGVEVLRLIRVAIGPVGLGDLAKGKARELTREEILALKMGIRGGDRVRKIYCANTGFDV